MTPKRVELAQSELIAEIPLACANEQAAVEFLERQRWGATPCCPVCGSVAVYQMREKTGDRSKRFLWRCRDCRKQYTVRTGTVYAESLIPLHKWCHALWAAASAKNGVSALEISRRIQVSYKTALFLMHRIRHAMTDNPENPDKLDGIVEADETYVGGKPRFRGGNKRGRGTRKQPVAAVLQRGGTVRTRVIPMVNSHNLKAMVRDNVATTARLMTDKEVGYKGLGAEFASHETVDHGRREYARGDVTTNGIEGFFARVKRGINGVYHNVSKEHLGRYMDHFAFMHNTRKLNDGERTLAIMKQAEGKRLMYRDPVTR
ncbi:IS1595-like element ISSod11 family transposase [soil metagenome]